MSRLDPLGLQLPVATKLIELKPETYGLTEDLSISAANGKIIYKCLCTVFRASYNIYQAESSK